MFCFTRTGDLIGGRGWRVPEAGCKGASSHVTSVLATNFPFYNSSKAPWRTFVLLKCMYSLCWWILASMMLYLVVFGFCGNLLWLEKSWHFLKIRRVACKMSAAMLSCCCIYTDSHCAPILSLGQQCITCSTGTVGARLKACLKFCREKGPVCVSL